MNNTHKDNIILGIESSCDDTSAAVLINGKVYSNVVANQDVHSSYGGVVPELASRAHQQNIVPVVDKALKQANVKATDLSAIAFTKGPGLLGSLMVGTAFAKSFALGLNIPIIDVHHMKAHVHAHFIQKPNENVETPNFPFLCLTVSGGHTQIVLIKSPLKMTIIGETIDDAAGEAFDKAAKQLGIDYPGGPLIDKMAKDGNEKRFKFTYPKVAGLNYSFSGLKTQFLYFLQEQTKSNSNFIEENKKDICASYQSHVVSYLLKKLALAIKETGCKDVAIAGGVSANSKLRKELINLGAQTNCNVFIPSFEFCTDNAAMIAMSGYFMYKEKLFAKQNVTPQARINI
jgi:N6-L-threonylcarbamoyladenine synthase